MRLLIVEDNAADAELTVRQLTAEGIDCTWTRVATEDAFRDALLSAPDVIISDCTLPCFDGMAAFSIAAVENPGTPFVFVSGTLGDERAREALKAGAAGYIAKGNRERLGQTVRSALERGRPRRRRARDRFPLPGSADAGTGAAQHLLARRRVLDDTLQEQDSPAMTSIMLRAAPSPAALLVIEAELTRDRFAKLLPMANLEIETAQNADEALAALADRVHALMFTDDIDLIRSARQLPSGEATHIVFVSSGRLLLQADAIRAGANDCVSSDTRGEHFWTHVTNARRIADFAASLERAARLGQPLAIVMGDIDHFKKINDHYGHQTGDQVLKEFCNRIADGLRVERDWVARLGGDEFAIVLPDTAAAEACAVANRLCERIRSEAFADQSGEISITASFGVCALDQVCGSGSDLAERMVSAADAALYQSKRRGRDCVTAGRIAETEGLTGNL